MSADNRDTAPPADNTETGNSMEKQKTLKEGAVPSSTAESGCCCNDKSLGIFCLDIYIDKLALVNHLIRDIDTCSVVPVSLDNERDWIYVERFKSAIVIYTSQTSAAQGPCLRRFLDLCSRTHGSENMIMVRIDLEDTESMERKNSQWESDQYCQCPLVTLTKAELDVISTSDRTELSVEKRMENKVTQMKKILQPGAEGLSGQFPRLWKQKNKPIIGIFSRDEKSQYSWLVTTLTSDVFKGQTAEVRPCHISNTGFEQFSEAVSQCTFGILYHSKTRGRINVTNVNGSLYDNELEHLCSRLGKKNVIVVIDDLEDSSDQRKISILEHQPSITEMAGDLFLISHEEKTSNYQRHLMVNREEVERKLQRLRDIIRSWKTGKRNVVVRDDFEVSSDQQKISILKPQTSIRAKAQDSSLINQEKTSNYQRHLTVNTEKVKSKMQRLRDNIRKLKTDDSQKAESSTKRGNIMLKKDFKGVEFSFPHLSSKKSVGIFSRSSDSEYSWLKRLLESQDFRNSVTYVQAYYISSSFSKFCNDVSQCKFGILYHTKNRGRINVTNVMDSLYDEELKYLSSTLGKKNVVVVIDDLEDASDIAKERILHHQPSIRELAQDLILVMSSEEKMRAKKDAIKNLFTDNKQ